MRHLPRRERLPLLLLLPVAALCACAGQATTDSVEADSPVLRGADVSSALRHDDSAPLKLMPVPLRSSQRIEHEVKKLPRQFNTSAPSDPVLQRSAPALLMPATSLNFDGVGQGFSGPQGTFTVNSAPPDTNGDIGPNHYVQTVNTDFAVFNKSGTVLYGPVPINALWSGFGGDCQTNNDGDPVVIYDSIADRWVISQFSVTGANGTTKPFLQCVAISQTADPTGAYYRYSFPYSGFNDYPKMGVWPDAYYTTFNMFNAAGTTFQGSKICAFDRAKMLAGQATTQQCFNTSTSYGGLLPADLDGTRLPPAGTPNYVLALGATVNTLAFWKFHVDWTTPANSTFTGPTTLSTAAYSEACGASGTCIPQSGTTQQLDSLGDRLMFRLAYRNFGDHEALVVNHSITAGSSTGVRWYEVRVASGTPSIFQQGTYAPDAAYRWMGSIAMDKSGNMGLGFSTSSSTLHPEVRYTGRLAADAAGAMTQGEGTILAGAGSQTGSSLSRWGDYSMMGVDPVDDCTFWFTTEYIPGNGAFNWKTRIGSFRFPSCGTAANDFSIAANPNAMSLAPNATGTSTISTALVAGSAETINLTVSGVPAGATASLSPASVTTGETSTLTVNAGTAAAGTYTLTVTGTAPSISHSTAVTLTVQGAPDFSVSISPSSGAVAAGGTTTFNVGTTAINGSTQTISLSVSGLPAGVTGSFSPSSVTAGSGSTLTLTAASTAAAATATFTVSGTSGTVSHAASAQITVTTPSGDTALSNGVPVSNLSGATGSQQYFFISVPAAQATLTVQISGGTGDADLYVRFGSRPTTATYDCRPYLTGNNETCTISNPAAGNHYIMLNGYAAYSGVTLKATYAADTTTPLTNGVPVTGISGASGSAQYWKLAVPAGQAKVVFTISGGTGDADLYVRRGARPTTTTYDCRPYLTGNNETCTITSPVAGDYFVMLRGYTAFSGVTLKGQYP